MRAPVTLAEDAAKLLSGGRPSEPVGTIHVVDPNALNWLYITYNTVEELVRVDTRGNTIPAAMSGYKWADDRTLEITVRENEVFPDGEPLSAARVKRAFDEVMRWQAPHPPGTQFNLDPRAQMEVTGEQQVRLILPEPDGAALGKLRAMHIMSSRFWDEVGFGYKKKGTGEGHW